MNTALATLAPLVLAVGAHADLVIEPVPAHAPGGFGIVFSKHVDGNLVINVDDLLLVIGH